jgi:hypothetical protein
MGTLDSLIVPGYTKDILGSDAESEGRRNRLKVFAQAAAKSARKGTITDLEGFAQVAAFAISPFQIMDAASNSGGIFDLGEIYIELYLDDLKSVLIGDGWTNTERNYGKYALPYNSFLDTGFKPEYRDGGNQVQHAMAGIYISNIFGITGRVFAHWQEDEDADLALYDATFKIGRDLDGHKSNFAKLPNMIRTRLAA